MPNLLAIADRIPIRKQIGLMGAALAFGIACVVTLSAASVARRQAAEDARGDLLALARTMAERLDAHMADRYREIKTIAGLAPLSTVWHEDPGRIRGVLSQIQASLPEYAWIGFAGPDGIVKSATGGLLEGASVAARPWFAEGLTGATVQDVHQAKLLSSLLPRPSDGAPFRFVDVAMPVRDDGGNLAGVLGAHLSWSWADDLRRVVLATQGLANGTDIWVLSADGTALLGAEDGRRPFGPDQLSKGTFVDEIGSEPQLTTVVRTVARADYPGLGWSVVARRPVSVALGPAERLVRLILMLGTLAAAIGIGLAWALGAAIARPITRLTSAVDQIGRNPKAGVDLEHGSREIVTLSIALRSLLRRVGSAEREASKAHRMTEQVQTEANETRRSSEDRTRRLAADMAALRAEADRDPLTGLLNRRAFLPFADDAMNQFKRYERPVGIIMFDIDRFKAVNDTFGHAAGDAVIQRVGEEISAAIRTTDKVARFGGEEFVVLLRECDAKSAEMLANRIRETISRTLVEVRDATLKVTISGGVALACASDRDIQDVIERADRGLYAAKGAGRNRIDLAPSASTDLAQAA